MTTKTKKIIFLTILAVVLGVAGFLSLPSNYFLRKALVNLLPKIDQYPIFENRTVKAGDPSAWEEAGTYNAVEIPQKYLDTFEELETIAFLVIKDSAIVFEEYWDGYSPRSHSNSFSMAKSIVSLALGCAIDDGFIRDVDQPVSDFFPEFGAFNGKELTIRHLLTMSAGVDFQEAYSSPFSPTTKLYYGNDLHKIAFGMKQIEEPGVNFVYQSGVTQLLAFLVTKATGEELSSYVSRKLWTPIQAESDALWSLDREVGMEKAYCCFNSNARDFARFGQLILNKGKWNGKQVVSEEYITAATTPDTSLVYKEHNVRNDYYGFQFWNLEYDGMDIPYMRGILGQYVLVVPEENAVIVRLGRKRSDSYEPYQHYPADIDTWLGAGLDIIAAYRISRNR